MSSAELEALMAEPVTNCPHGMADPEACEDCRNPAPRVSPSAVMRIPEEYRGAAIDYLAADLRSLVAPFCEQWPPETPVVWLGGNVGAGKTYTACALLWAVYGRYSVFGRYWSAADIVDGYRAASDPDYEGPWTAPRLDDALMLAPLLVIDDLGAERETEFGISKLYRVVDARYRERRPTIVTTNREAEDIDPRIRSRLLSGIEVRFTGKDRRTS